jgi:hypothetical protein
LPLDFPPIHMPLFLGLINHRSGELEYDMFMDECDNNVSIVVPVHRSSAEV